MAERLPWDWDGLAEAQRRSRAGLSHEQRWEWLIAALELASASGALAVDRRRRAALAAAWDLEGGAPSTDDAHIAPGA
ncbi:hypothetical protein [Euzebya tangerina]|uniref:hypothetical protein n=1 Tax=Euzebya tangerina TaxID=591198 RepID=UPI000E31F60E|nr:hypothetical protein [Euzebya tangerina]